MAGGRVVPGLVLDVDATLVEAHCEKEFTAATFKGGWGYHPLLVWLDNTNEALAGMLRPGNAGANTAADHVTVIDQALAQIPDADRHGTPLLVRADGAGCTRAWLAHLRALRDRAGPGPAVLGRVHDERAGPGRDPRPAAGGVDAGGRVRRRPPRRRGRGRAHRDAAGPRRRRLAGRDAGGGPPGAPAPGAQLRFTDVDGWRFQAFATDTPTGQLAWLEARHRAHARVEDRIRCAKDTGIGRFPSRLMAVNAAWLQLALTACDLIAWTQTTLLDGDLAVCEPKALRYRLMHVAARLTRGQRHLRLRIPEHWPWRAELTAAFARLAALRSRCGPDPPQP